MRLTICLFLLISATTSLAAASDENVDKAYTKDPSNRGWDYLIQRLTEDGVPVERAQMIFRDKRMPAFSLVYFSLDPKESSRLYTSFYSQEKLRTCKTFLQQHRTVFDAVDEKLGVSRYVIASILLVETQFGKVTGSQSIIYRLARLAVIGAPDNIQANIERLIEKDPKIKAEDVIERAKYLEDMFYPELPALLQIASDRKIDVFDIRGSRAGAFGFPQFLPSTYLKFAIDGNNDGVKSLYQFEDAIWSVGNFLASYGWKDELPLMAQREVVWKYNHSDAYVSAILGVAEKLQKNESGSP